MNKPAFLDVEKSVKGQRWVARLDDQRLAHTIAEKNELPEILGRVMAARGVTPDEAEAFLNPTLRSLMPQPSAFMDMEKVPRAWLKPS
jgi:single-stranded-DNA-specific exonuclease